MGSDHTAKASWHALPVRGLLPLVLPFALALAGCAAPAHRAPPPAYVAPGGGPTARLVMRGTVLPGEAYGVYRYDEAEHCLRPSTMGSGDATHHPASTTIVAGQLTTVMFSVRLSPTLACWALWSFTPLAGKHYLVAGNSVPNGCRVRILDATDSDNIVPEPSAVRRDSKQGFCMPLAQARAQVHTTEGSAGTQAAAGAGHGTAGTEAVLKPNASDDDLRGLVGQ